MILNTTTTTMMMNMKKEFKGGLGRERRQNGKNEWAM